MLAPDALRERVEAYLTDLTLTAELGQLRDAVSYSLLGGGKRIRPVLGLAAGEALGVDVDRMLAAACSLELVHTFSLVHDDLPALDDDDLRRGQPSCHAKFGEAVAILAGDALLSEALRLALTYERPHVAREVVDATLGMIGGQYIDITTNGSLDAEGLVELHRLKTGKLLAAPIGCALAVAGVEEGENNGRGVPSPPISACCSRSSTTCSTRQARRSSSARRRARTPPQARSPTRPCTGSSGHGSSPTRRGRASIGS